MTKILKKNNEAKDLFIPKVGDLVYLSGERLKRSKSPSLMNPMIDSSYECNGKVIAVNKLSPSLSFKYSIIVAWSNGSINSYVEGDLSECTEDKYVVPEVFRAACNVIIGKKQIISKGEKLYSEGNYIMNKDSSVIFDVNNESLSDIFPKSYLRNKEN